MQPSTLFGIGMVLALLRATGSWLAKAPWSVIPISALVMFSVFGAKIVQERVFEDTGGARRTDSGLVQIQRQIPLFTQSAPDHDVLVAADESEVFASRSRAVMLPW